MPARLSVSNLAWGVDHHKQVLTLLAGLGVRGVEVAPTRIAPWADLSPDRLRRYRSEVEAAGLSISSLQAIFFGVEEARLLHDSLAFEAMSEQFRLVAEIGAILGAEIAVYGAPRTRMRGNMSHESARGIAMERFSVLGDIAQSFGVSIGIEPIPGAYGGDFLTSAFEVIEFVRELRHPFVRLHLDTGCVLLAGDKIDEAIRGGIPWLRHFHVSEPQLGDFTAPTAQHGLASASLRHTGYEHWIAIEMIEQDVNPIEALSTAIRFAMTTYEIT